MDEAQQKFKLLGVDITVLVNVNSLVQVRRRRVFEKLDARVAAPFVLPQP